jgi:hypothetical protein
MDYQPQLTHLVDMLRARAREQIEERGEAVLTFGLLITCDPKTGAPLQPTGVGLLLLIAPVVASSDEDAEDMKDQITMRAKAVAIAGGAVACVTCMDAWVSVDPEMDASGRVKRMPREDPKRQECIVLMVEESNGKHSMERTVYRRDEGRILFDEPERSAAESGGDPVRMRGRFVILPDPRHPPPQHVVVAMRAFVNFNQKLTWESVS